MTCRHIATVLAASLLLPACIATRNLGVDAQEAGGGGGEGEGDGGGEDDDEPSGSSTDGGGETSADPQVACEQTGGRWDENACHHYVCGVRRPCRALIPGCDCGMGHTFETGQGCVLDPTCESTEFTCGPNLDCSLPSEYCSEFVPGVPGPSSFTCAAVPNACERYYSCECLEEAGVVAEGDCEQAIRLGITVTSFAP